MPPQLAAMESLIGGRGEMRIVLVSCVFPPEPLTSAYTSHSLAYALMKRGHDVQVITSYPSRPGGRVFPGFRRRLFGQRQRDNDVEVVRCFSTTSRSSTLLSRFVENLSFGLFAGGALVRGRRPDAIYVNTWPIFATGIVSLIAGARSVPLVLSVQDVYPESLIVLNKLSSGSVLARLLRWFDACIAHSAAAVVTISEGVEEIYLRDRGIPQECVHRIANWREMEDLPANEAIERWRNMFGTGPDAFLFVFAGNVAAACGVEDVISTVSGLDDELPVMFVVAGSGGALERCRGVVARYQTAKVKFIGPFQANETLPILSAGDVLILPTQGDQSLVSMPSKLVSYLMSGRPVLAIARHESDLARVVNGSGCGWVVEPGDSDALARQLRAITVMDRLDLARKGALGREYALTHFSAEFCLPKLITVVEGAVRG